jgi:hypothetical protein
VPQGGSIEDKATPIIRRSSAPQIRIARSNSSLSASDKSEEDPLHSVRSLLYVSLILQPSSTRRNDDQLERKKLKIKRMVDKSASEASIPTKPDDRKRYATVSKSSGKTAPKGIASIVSI